jgi:gluconolactonase
MIYPQAPEWRTAEIFSEMPAALRRTGVHSVWGDANRGGVAIDSFLEGPVFDEAGNLYVTDIPFGRIFRIDAAGNWSQIAEYDGEPNGMKFISSTTLLIADYKNGLVRLDIETGKTDVFLERRNTERFKGINDLVFDARGNLYFTDQGQSGLHDPCGRVYRLTPSGRLDALLENVPSPNGLVLSPDETVLFVAATRGNCVWRVPLMPDGSVAKVGLFFTSHGPSGPDGLAMDEAGNLVVANPGLGYAWLLNKRAEPVVVWRSPKGMSLTNMAYGGPQRKTLYCTESVSGTLLRMEMPEAGMPLHRPPADWG